MKYAVRPSTLIKSWLLSNSHIFIASDGVIYLMHFLIISQYVGLVKFFFCSDKLREAEELEFDFILRNPFPNRGKVISTFVGIVYRIVFLAVLNNKGSIFV